ncbi:MAG TPA: serine/threonine-protein kinase [Verrucomicrobiae bacterium]|nr:serine/threonine-protein kinase [Verrucomicrobiae bacterium]
MMPNADRLIELYTEANARLAGAERDRFLLEACGEDAALRKQIISLLQSHQDAGEFLTEPIFPPLLVATEKPGDIIGRYTLLEKLGEGGCGVVYVAEQSTPVRRRVALKVVKLGMDTKSVIARFEAERQALAIMDHPNIAKVFDAGATDTGRPYFVMELVRGMAITQFCDEHRLLIPDRLGLFIKVCGAIQHAHQKGIIHRDIKPSNILVALRDGIPVPRVIDFGSPKPLRGGSPMPRSTRICSSSWAPRPT